MDKILFKLGFRSSEISDNEWHLDVNQKDTKMFIIKKGFKNWILLRIYDEYIDGIYFYGLEETINEGEDIREVLLPILREERLSKLLDI